MLRDDLRVWDEAEFFDPISDLISIQTQQATCANEVPLRRLQRLKNEAAFYVRENQAARRKPEGALARRRIPETATGRAEIPALGEEDDALDGVSEFAHVAGPSVRGQTFDHAGLDADHALVEGATELDDGPNMKRIPWVA